MAVIKIVPMPGAEGQQGDQGAVGPQGPQGETGAQGPAGADALWSYNGTWQSNATYAEGDLVTYDGQLYYATDITTLGTTPDLDVNFDLITTKGEQGIQGEPGPQGEVGPQGEQGIQGEPGESGVSSETVFVVNGGTTGTQPTFDGSPLFSGSYISVGDLVHFQIQVDMDNILTFGTGQYFVDLPLPAKYGYQVREGCLHDTSTGRQYSIGGHVFAGQSQLLLSFTDSNGQDAAFDYNSPVTLSTADNFHISGTYITI